MHDPVLCCAGLPCAAGSPLVLATTLSSCGRPSRLAAAATTTAALWVWSGPFIRCAATPAASVRRPASEPPQTTAAAAAAAAATLSLQAPAATAPSRCGTSAACSSCQLPLRWQHQHQYQHKPQQAASMCKAVFGRADVQGWFVRGSRATSPFWEPCAATAAQSPHSYAEMGTQAAAQSAAQASARGPPAVCVAC